MSRWMGGVSVVVLLLIGAASAAAQSAVGVRAGARWSELQGSQAGGSMQNLVAAGYFGFGLSSRLAVQFEGVYGTRGGTLRVGADELDEDATASAVEMRYVELPVLLRAGFPGQRLLPSFFFGPYVGFLLGCDIRPSGEPGRACDTESATERFVPQGTDLGVVAGAGLDLRLGGSTVFVDARYSLGLFSIHGDENPFDARHTGLAVSGGFAVPVGR